ncbi:glycosyltransferase [Nocardioides currus]|uniref:glycosyltransferase n=1 Tax=Nocardioides currus TaxID=2133958 RepID=UPI00140349A5|nr:glycosyltransferase [Nocardioides currus]
MKILVDALPADFGGIRTYAQHLLAAWPATAPDDEVHVLLADDSHLPVPDGVVAHRVPLGHRRSLSRAVAQSRHLPRLVRELRPDAVLATLPSTTVRRLGAPLVVVVHDLRHDLRPDQFGRVRRVLRRVSYARGYALADAHLAISRRTLDDLHTVHPRTRSTPSAVVHHGADHVAGTPGAGARTGPVVTFAHQTNKNADLVRAGWRVLGPDAPELVVLGDPYVPDEEYAAWLGRAAVVVMASDFEGFGLPVLEGMRLGVPVVVGPDPAMLEVAGGHAFAMTGWTPDEVARATREALAADGAVVAAAIDHAASFTWARTVSGTRELVRSVL